MPFIPSDKRFITVKHWPFTVTRLILSLWIFKENKTHWRVILLRIFHCHESTMPFIITRNQRLPHCTSIVGNLGTSFILSCLRFVHRLTEHLRDIRFPSVPTVLPAVFSSIAVNNRDHLSEGILRIELMYLFFHRISFKQLLFLSCRPFAVITTISTGLVDVEVTSVSSSTPTRPVENVVITTKGPLDRNNS